MPRNSHPPYLSICMYDLLRILIRFRFSTYGIMIPQTDKEHNDYIDFLFDACQTIEDVVGEDGSLTKQLQTDPEIAWCKTQLINSNTFGRCVLELKDFEGLAVESYYNMSKEMADLLSQQILSKVRSYKRSIDAKSSETRRNKNNAQSALLHLMARNKVEKEYTIKDNMKKSAIMGFLGKDQDKDEENS